MGISRRHRPRVQPHAASRERLPVAVRVPLQVFLQALIRNARQREKFQYSSCFPGITIPTQSKVFIATRPTTMKWLTETVLQEVPRLVPVILNPQAAGNRESIETGITRDSMVLHDG